MRNNEKKIKTIRRNAYVNIIGITVTKIEDISNAYDEFKIIQTEDKQLEIFSSINFKAYICFKKHIKDKAWHIRIF